MVRDNLPFLHHLKKFRAGGVESMCLGLFIAKKLLQQFDEDLFVKSNPTLGTEVAFKFKLD